MADTKSGRSAVTRLETTQWSTLAVCYCGWRQIRVSRAEAEEVLQYHEETAHPTDKRMQAALRCRRWRANHKENSAEQTA